MTTTTTAAPAATAEPLDQRSTQVERARVATIRRFEDRLGRQWADGHIEAGSTVEAVREQALERLMAIEAKAPTSTVRAGDDFESPAFRTAAMVDAFTHRLAGDTGDLPGPARQFRGMTVSELAAELLVMRGVETRRLSRSDVIKAALETRTYATHGVADFPFFLAETGQRAIQRLYETWPAALKMVSTRLNVRDFRTAKIGRAGEFPALLAKPEHAEIEAGTVATEDAESYGVSTFARAFGWSREAMINDDLGLYEQFVRSIAMSVEQLEAEKLVAVLTANAAMADGNALFSTAHGNLVGSPAALSVASIDAVRKLMRQQKGVNGTTALNVGPAYLIVPAGLETVGEQLLAPLFAATVDEANPFAARLSLVVESRLDAAGLDWYLAAQPARMPSLAYVMRDGAEGPQVETEVNFATKGISISVVHDFGATAIDWRGIAKMPAVGGG